MYVCSQFANNMSLLLSLSLILLRSTPVPGNHWEGQVLAVLALDRGDKSLSTPEDSLPVGKLGTSLSRPCHTLPCRSSLIGLAMWRIQPTYVTTRRALDASRFWKKTGRENCIMEGQKKKGGTEMRYFKIGKTKIYFLPLFLGKWENFTYVISIQGCDKCFSTN